MKIVGIFNKKEETVGFRLSGLDSNFIQTSEDLSEFLKKLKQDTDIGLLVISQEIYNLLAYQISLII